MIQLKPEQQLALEKMKNGCILTASSPELSLGSGKSLTSIAYYYIQNGGKFGKNYTKMKDPCDLYIITTAQKRDKFEWDAELSHFLLSTNPEVNIYSNKVVVDSWNNIKKYVGVKDSFFIFDEQRVVGYGTWSKSFLKIAKANQWILLSATPGDKWEDYIPIFIANGFYKNKSEFVQNHIVYKAFTSFPQVDRYLNIGRLIRLRNSILVDMDIKRSTVPHHETINVTYDVHSYKGLCSSRWNPFQDKPIDNASEFCYCLRRIVNSDESRQVSVLEILEKHPKAIIFYNFDYELELLKSLSCSSWGKYEVAEWNGHKHQPIPDSDAWIYLVQYTAGCEGWNCVETDTIIFYSQNYSYKVMQQACGRIDRLNTPFTDLYYYHLDSKAGIDLAIKRALKKKKKFNERGFCGI